MERWTQPAAVRQLVWPPRGSFFLFPQFVSKFISHLKPPNYSDLYFCSISVTLTLRILTSVSEFIFSSEFICFFLPAEFVATLLEKFVMRGKTQERFWKELNFKKNPISVRTFSQMVLIVFHIAVTFITDRSHGGNQTFSTWLKVVEQDVCVWRRSTSIFRADEPIKAPESIFKQNPSSLFMFEVAHPRLWRILAVANQIASWANLRDATHLDQWEPELREPYLLWTMPAVPRARIKPACVISWCSIHLQLGRRHISRTLPANTPETHLHR